MLIGFLFSYLLYGRKSFIFYDGEKKHLKYILAFLRFLSTSLICFLLLSPLLKTTSTDELKPSIVILQDNSASLKNSINLPTYKKDLEDIIEKLSKKYKVIYHQFGSHLEDNDKPELNFSQQETNIDQALKHTFLQYDHQNIGAVILASDGIFNVGNNPIYNTFALKTPIYTVALGDTVPQKDLLIKNLLYPEVVYLGDNFNIQIDIAANFLNNEISNIQVIDNYGKIVLNKSISINNNNFTQTENIVGNADKAGIISYTVKLQNVKGETIKENNIDVAYIEVIDGRQNVLVLFDAPHPDIKALRYAIESNKNYKFEAKPIHTFNFNFSLYDIVILHGVPSTISTSNQIAALQNLMASSTPVLFILSAQSNLNTFNSIQHLLKISGNSTNGNDVQPIYQNNFSNFILDEKTLNTLKQLPPLLSPYGKYDLKANGTVLFNQRIGSVVTQNPLITFSDENGKKIGIFAGEGWWRWRLNEFMQNNNTLATDELINKSIQYLTVKTDKRKFKINASKKIFNSNEPILLDAQLYNESFILVNEPEVIVKINNGKNSYQFVFDKTLNAYTLNAGILPVGNYTAKAETNYKGKKFTATTVFSIKPINLELQNTQANWNLLATLSNQSGGKLVTSQSMKSLVDSIQNNSSIHSILFENTQTKPLIDWKILFAIILFLLSAEWFIRKYNGIT